MVSSKKPNRALKSFAQFGGDKQFATTLARGLAILRCFSPQDPFLGNKELAQRTGLPKPTVFRLTYTLSHLGYLKVDKLSSKFQLGSAVLTIGYPLLAAMTIRQVARPAMKVLADYAGGAVSMGIRDELNIVYVETCRSSSMFAVHFSDIGMSQPIATSAIGRSYLGACAAEERRALLNVIKIKTPEIWASYSEKLKQSLLDFENFGFCISLGDSRKSVRAVGVSLRIPSTGNIVSFNCAFPSLRVTSERLHQDIGPRLLAMARGIISL